MKPVLLSIIFFFFFIPRIEAQDDALLNLTWLRNLVDSLETETEICISCTSDPEIKSYLTPGGIQRFRLRIQCDEMSSATIHYGKDGQVVAACIVDANDRNCEDGPAFTAYTFGQEITTIWTCVSGFDCMTTPSSVLFPSYSMEVQDDLCNAEEKILYVTESFSSYLWTFPNGDSSDMVSVATQFPGLHRVIVTEENGCMDTMTLNLDLTESIPPMIQGATTICDEQGTSLFMEGFAAYTWSDGSTGSGTVFNSPGSVFVIATNEAGCIDTIRTIIKDGRNSMVNIEGAGVDIFEGQEIELSLTYENLSFDDLKELSWSIGTDIIENAEIISYRVDQAVTISITVVSLDGCIYEDQISIDPLPISRNIYFPTSFNPHSSLGNDRFLIQSIPGTIDLMRLTLYDRWGAPVFDVQNATLNDYEESWDGKKNGQYAPAGIYVYVAEVRYADNSTEIMRGGVLLIY